jgi:hypothetical protein
MPFRKRVTLMVAIVVLFVLALGAVYRYITTGGLIARQKPPAVEASVTGIRVQSPSRHERLTTRNSARTGPHNCVSQHCC